MAATQMETGASYHSYPLNGHMLLSSRVSFVFQFCREAAGGGVL